MAVVERVTEFDCPQCSQRIAQEADGPTACAACGWRGEALLFRPSPLEAEKAQDALEEATARLKTYEALAQAEQARVELEAVQAASEDVVEQARVSHPELTSFVFETVGGDAVLAAKLLKTLTE